MSEYPDKLELLEAVAGALRDELLPGLEGRQAFVVKVAINALGIVRREIEQRPDADEAARQRLRDMLGSDVGDLDTLTEALCDRIASAEVTLQTPGLKEYLWDSTRRRVAIDQPRYSGYRRAVETD